MDLPLIQEKIYLLRGQRVLLDFDLAQLYETETKPLRETVRRNMARFPDDFMFELTAAEWAYLSSKMATPARVGKPFAFTEHGVTMLAGMLRSPKAVAVNISMVRAFVVLRQFALENNDLTQRIQGLEQKYETKLSDIEKAVVLLLQERLSQQGLQQKTADFTKRPRIGFKPGV
jgi:hypothetical protein